jgi:hypothetical protein
MATYEELRQEFEHARLALQSIIAVLGQQATAPGTTEAKETWQGHAENAKDVLRYLESKKMILTGGDTQAYIRTSSGR